MNNLVENSVRMITTSVNTCSQHSSITSRDPIMERTLSDLRDKLSALMEANLKKERVSTGIVMNKNAREKELIPAILTGCSALTGYGLEANNLEVVTLTDVTESDLVNKSEPELGIFGRIIYNELNTRISDLDSFGYRYADLDELDRLLTNFNDLVVYVPVAISERVSATAELKSLVKEAKIILRKRLDKQMKRYRKSNPDFYKAYRAARKMPKYGVRHEAASGGDVVTA